MMSGSKEPTLAQLESYRKRPTWGCLNSAYAVICHPAKEQGDGFRRARGREDEYAQVGDDVGCRGGALGVFRYGGVRGEPDNPVRRDTLRGDRQLRPSLRAARQWVERQDIPQGWQ